MTGDRGRSGVMKPTYRGGQRPAGYPQGVQPLQHGGPVHLMQPQPVQHAWPGPMPHGPAANGFAPHHRPPMQPPEGHMRPQSSIPPGIGPVAPHPGGLQHAPGPHQPGGMHMLQPTGYGAQPSFQRPAHPMPAPAHHPQHPAPLQPQHVHPAHRPGQPPMQPPPMQPPMARLRPPPAGSGYPMQPPTTPGPHMLQPPTGLPSQPPPHGAVRPPFHHPPGSGHAPMPMHPHPPAMHAGPNVQPRPHTLTQTQTIGIKRPAPPPVHPPAAAPAGSSQPTSPASAEVVNRHSGIMRPLKGPAAHSHGRSLPSPTAASTGAGPPGASGAGAESQSGRGGGVMVPRKGPAPVIWTPAGPSRPTGGHSGGGAEARPNKKTRKEREFEAAADAAMRTPVVVRAPASEEERKEVEKWKEERRRGYPTSANLSRKAAEEAQRQDSGALDPRRQERLKRLREVLALQRSMGVDHIAGTSDLTVDANGYHGGYGDDYGYGAGRGGGRVGTPGGGTHARPGGEGGAGDAAAARAAEPDVPREVAGGVATKYQWVRKGYVPPPASNAGEGQDGQAGGAAAAAGTQSGHAGVRPSQPHQHGAQAPQQQQRQYMPRPRAPSLLQQLLAKDIRKDKSWLLQSIRFLIRNNFLQPRPSPAAAAAGAAGPSAAAAGRSAAGSGACTEDGAPKEAGNALASAATARGVAGDPLDIDWPPEPEEQDLAALLAPVLADEDVDAEAEELAGDAAAGVEGDVDVEVGQEGHCEDEGEAEAEEAEVHEGEVAGEEEEAGEEYLHCEGGGELEVGLEGDGAEIGYGGVEAGHGYDGGVDGADGVHAQA